MSGKLIRASCLAVLAIYVVALLVYFPARFAVALLPIPEKVQLQGVTGTIWQGQVAHMSLPQQQALQSLSWQLKPWQLLRGQVVAHFALSPAAMNPVAGGGQIQLSFTGQIAVTNLRLQGDLGAVASWLQVPNLVPLQGELVLGLQNYRMGQPVCTELAARVGAYEVKTRIGSQWFNLGDFALQLGCEDGWAQVQIEPTNSLGLSVNGRLAPQNVDLAVLLRPTAATPAPVQDLLKLVGQPNQYGQFNFRFRL